MPNIKDFLIDNYGSPEPDFTDQYIVVGGGDFPVIGDIILSPYSKYSGDGGTTYLYDQLLMGQTFDELLYPRLYEYLGTNILDSVTSPSPTTPYRIIADLTEENDDA